MLRLAKHLGLIWLVWIAFGARAQSCRDVVVAPHSNSAAIAQWLQSNAAMLLAQPLAEHAGYKVILIEPQLLWPQGKMSPLMASIARARARSFAAVGEGNGSELDFDEFDRKQQQLVLLNPHLQVVGGYRLAEVSNPLAVRPADRAPRRRLAYSHQQLQYRRQFFKALPGRVLEVSRSYIVPEAQDLNGVGLQLIWRGIAEYVLRNPGVRYLLGLGSISRVQYPVAAQLEILDFYEHFFIASEKLTMNVNPKHPMEVPRDFSWSAWRAHRDSWAELESARKIKAMNSYLLETYQMRLPPLLEYYFGMLRASMYAHDVDGEFGTLDIALIVDLRAIPERVMRAFAGTPERSAQIFEQARLGEKLKGARQ